MLSLSKHLSRCINQWLLPRERCFGCAQYDVFCSDKYLATIGPRA